MNDDYSEEHRSIYSWFFVRRLLTIHTAPLLPLGSKTQIAITKKKKKKQIGTMDESLAFLLLSWKASTHQSNHVHAQLKHML